MRIGYKLILGYSLIAALSGVTMYLANRSYHQIDRTFDAVSSDSVPEIEALEGLKLAALRIIASTSEYMLIEAESINNSSGSTQIATERDLISSGVDNYYKALARYEPLVEHSSREQEYQRDIKKYGADLIRISAEMVNNKHHGAEALEEKEEFEQAEEKFLAIVDDALVFQKGQLDRRTEAMQSTIANSQSLTLVVFFLTLGLSIAIGLYISRSISRPLNQLRDASRMIGEGKLDTRIVIRSNDEIGELAAAFNKMTADLRQSQGEILRDITEQKRAEEALREAELKYRAIFENAEDGIFQTTADGKTITANPGMARMLGFDSPEELIRERTDIGQQEYVDPAQREEFKRLLNEHDVLQGFEYEVYRKDGSRIWISESVRAVRNDNGALLYYEGITKDITARKRSEAALQESEERFRQLSEAALEAIILHDQGTILEVNQSFCRMYGYERAEVIGKSVLDLALPEFRERLLQIVGLGTTEPYESPALRKDGTVFTAEVAGKPINYQGRVVRVAAIRDITEKKRSERRQAAQYAVTRVLAESATVAEAIPQLLKVICESLRWKMGEFWRLCDSTNVLRCVETWHVPALDATSFIEASRQTELAPGAGLPGRVWQSGQPAWIPDVMTDPGFARAAIAAKVGLRGAVAFPILLGNHTLGAMLFFSRRSPEVDEDLLKIMSAIGSQIGQFTDRKRAEEALLASERRYRDIVTFAPVGIYQSLRDGTLITANKALAEMLGYASVDELIKVKLGSGMYLSADERERLIREHEFRGYPVDRELQWKKKDGSPIWIQLSAHAIKGANGITEYWEGFVRDITERKRSEEALRKAEQKYRDIFENAGEGIFQSTPEGQFLAANPALARIHGYESPQELIQSLTDISSQIYVDSKRRDEFRYLLAEQGIVRAFEHQVLKKDGSRIWITVNARAVRDEQEQIMYYEGTAQDITERKRDHARLREYEKVVEGLDEMIVVVDRDYRYLLANRAYLRYRGLEKEKLIGRFVSEIVDKPAFEKEIKTNLESAFQGQIVKYEMKFTYPEVGERDLFISYFPIEGPEGVDRVACVLQDVTERKQAEQRLLYHARLLEEVHDAVIAVDERLTLTAWNRAAEQMYGWTAQEVLGCDMRDVVRSTKAEAERAANLRIVAEKGRCRSESVHHNKNGSAINIDGTIMALRNDGGEIVGYVFAYHDITKRKLAEEALRDYSRRLIEAQEAERQSISRELHDQIGQMLTAIRLNLESIGKPVENPNASSMIDEGIALVDHALKQVRDLSFELRPSLLDDLGLASALRWYSDRYAQRAGIRVTTTIEVPQSQRRLPRELETACFRIVQEALTNVARHARARNVLINLGTANNGISLSIKDDGIGFDEHSRNAATSPHVLGLRGMQERALALGGKLEINSAPARGTEIRAHFPNGHSKKLIT